MEAWYHFFIAVNDPPAQGSHGKLHWTAGIAGRTRRRGGGAAARGTHAADSSVRVGVLMSTAADDPESPLRIAALAQGLFPLAVGGS